VTAPEEQQMAQTAPEEQQMTTPELAGDVSIEQVDEAVESFESAGDGAPGADGGPA